MSERKRDVRDGREKWDKQNQGLRVAPVSLFARVSH